MAQIIILNNFDVSGQNVGANNLPNSTKQGNAATAEIVGNLEESVLMNELKANNMYGEHGITTA